MRKRTAGLLTVALLASVAPPLLLAPPAAAAAAKYADDFNGDGYRDLAVGSLWEVTGDTTSHAGAVTVLRGGTSGLTGRNARQYSYATAGVEGETSDFAMLGTSVLLRDYNRDNRAELVATAPEIGRLHLLRGTASGPTGAGSTMLTAAELGLGARSSFGARLAD